MQRACELVELLQCGDVLDGVIDILNYIPEEKVIPLEPEAINAPAGYEEADMVEYLRRLGVPVVNGMIHVPLAAGP